MGDDETKRQQYLREYYEHKGIQLEYDKIETNAGLRTLAKLMLNSMWGKFGQRLNKTQVQEFDDPQTFHRFLDTCTLDVRHVSIISDQLVEVHYQYQDEDIPVSPNLNIFVACFTTCWAVSASIKLWNCWGNVSRTMTPTRSFTWRRRGNPTRSWAITSASLPVNWTTTIPSKNLYRVVQRITGTSPRTATSNAKCGDSA